MTFEVLRETVRRSPFHSFTLRMNDGREFYVRHPEWIAVAQGHVYVIVDKTQRGIFLETALIASLQAEEENSSSG